MKILRLFFPGSFEDAQLYMGHLVVFSTERDVRLVEIQELTEDLEARYPAWKGVLTFCFARNDWLTSGAMTSLARNPALAQTLNATVDGLAATDLALDEHDVDLLGLQDFKQEADVILDTVFYGSRLYLGTSAGLFDYDIDWQRLTVDMSRERLEARCVSATAEYGAVNASCEDEGLFTGYDEFGWRGFSANGMPELTQTAPRSVRTSWYGTDLVNYSGPAQPELLRASVEEVNVDSGVVERERKVVTSFGAPTDELDVVVGELGTQRKVPQDDVQFVWNSSRAFFINTHNHGFFTAYRTMKTDSGIGFRRHGSTNGRVVGVHRFAGGWIVETDFRAYILTGGELVELLDEEPLSVRTFEGSKRYKRLIAITVENGVHLISAIDDF
jgi:hypothetical protein